LRVSVSPPVGADRSRAGSIGIGAAFVCGRRDSGAIARNSLGESVRITWRLPILRDCRRASHSAWTVLLTGPGGPSPSPRGRSHLPTHSDELAAHGCIYFRGADVSGRLNLHDRQVTCVCRDVIHSPFIVNTTRQPSTQPLRGSGSRPRALVPNRPYQIANAIQAGALASTPGIRAGTLGPSVSSLPVGRSCRASCARSSIPAAPSTWRRQQPLTRTRRGQPRSEFNAR
jgi:hypothetical protein